jgi:uncharacterized membrane protein
MWAVVLLLTPVVARVAYAVAPLVVMVYAIGALICHQQPERSFHLASFQLPVCARCTGLYLGCALAALVIGLGGFTRAIVRPRVALLIAAAPTAITVLYEWISGDVPANGIRALAALPLGLAVASIVLLQTGARPREVQPTSAGIGVIR